MNLYKLNVKKGKLNMNKTEYVAAVAEAAGMTKAQATIAVDVVKKAARTGRNPRTGKEIKIAATKAPKFKAGAVLKNAVK